MRVVPAAIETRILKTKPCPQISVLGRMVCGYVEAHMLLAEVLQTPMQGQGKGFQPQP